ncbi:MAG: M23 family metallopeptidase [Balneolaceae bacterium]
MSSKNHYYYDADNCEFVRVEQNSFDLVIYTACTWILNGVILAGIGLSLLSNYIGTPAEIALKAENETLIQQMEETRSSISTLESRMESIVEMDNEMYRSVLGLDPLSSEERMAGVGGSDPYSGFDVYSEKTSEILRWTASKIDNLERRIGIQKISFDEIKSYYNDNQDMLRHLPAIKPVNGVLLSGFGMRVHPVLKYRRMHEGLDFRAEVGTPVYATGDGTVKMSGRRGSYGLMLVLEHGNGYESRYAHLSGFADEIRSGAAVGRGDLIGYTGNTGMTQGPHLHYEIRMNGEAVDPIHYLISDTTPEEYKTYQDIALNNPMSMD